MNIFKRGGGEPAKPNAVQLGSFSEESLLLFFALLLPQRENSKGFLVEIIEPLATDLRMEFSRRWQRRGAEISIQFPAALPATCIEAGLIMFQLMTKDFRQLEVRAREAGPIITATAQQFSGAADLAAAILAAMVERFVEVPPCPTA